MSSSTSSTHALSLPPSLSVSSALLPGPGQGEGEGEFNGIAPLIPINAGVVYVPHYETADLHWFRVDGATPEEAGSMGVGGVTHDGVLDPVNDVLYLVHDIADTIDSNTHTSRRGRRAWRQRKWWGWQ